jgi:alpha-tubulin suppressor-like RCC1 family protein
MRRAHVVALLTSLIAGGLAPFAACVPPTATETADAATGDGAAGDAAPRDATTSPDSSSPDAGPDAGPDGYTAGDADSSVDSGLWVIGRVALGGAYPSLFQCGIRSGALQCIGADGFYQLGRGPDAGDDDAGLGVLGPVIDPEAGAPFMGATQVAAGGSSDEGFACAVRGDEAFCWGVNEHNELARTGDSPPIAYPVAALTDIAELHGVKQVVTGGYHACALLEDGGVSCWGSNVVGQLCSPSLDSSGVGAATPVPAFAGAQSVALGQWDSCAVTPNGQVVCCGGNVLLQTGQAVSPDDCSDSPCVTAPSIVPGVNGAVQVATDGHTCAVLSSGALACWGQDDYGQIGVVLDGGPPLAPDGGPLCVDSSNNPLQCTATVVTVQPPTGKFVQVAVTDTTTCALNDGKEVWCWGENDHGECGQGSSTDAIPAPLPVKTAAGQALENVVGVAGKDGLFCAVDTTNQVYCWGNGVTLFDSGTFSFYAVPVPL